MKAKKPTAPKAGKMSRRDAPARLRAQVRHTVQTMTIPRPRLELVGEGGASPEEGAAIVAALERFMRATAAAPEAGGGGPEPWQRAAILEGVSRDPGPVASDPWINT
jgi:hypothetical protein